MKKIISVIVILVIILVIIALIGSSKAPATNTENVNTEETASTTTPKPIGIEGVTLIDGSYSVNPADAKLSWTGKKTLIKDWVDKGTIGIKEANFEVKNGLIVSNSFVIDMTSINNLTNGSKKNQDQLTKHLKSVDFFDTEQFPTSTFVAKEFTATTSNKFIVKGDLTIKGITNEISIPATFAYTDNNIIVVKGNADIDRTLWNVRYGSDNFFDNLGNNVIDDMFSLSFELQLKMNVVIEGTSTSTVESI